MLDSTIKTLPPSTDAMRAFADWVAATCAPETLALDVGAGYDRNQLDSVVRARVARLVGIDPAETILRNAAIHERYQISLEEFASTDGRRFDLIYAAWVLEHVGDPPRFFSSCLRLLKPGGTFFTITPNLRHYFGLITKASATAGLEDRLLSLLIGREYKGEYHFPTAYRANTIRSITSLLESTGFVSVEFRCCDRPEDYYYVVPRALHIFPRLYSRLVYRLNLASYMGRIMVRATAPP